MWIARYDVVDAPPETKLFEHEINGNPRSANDRFAGQYGRINRNAVREIHRLTLITLHCEHMRYLDTEFLRRIFYCGVPGKFEAEELIAAPV